MRCWGFGSSGQLGTGATADVGDNEPAAAGVVALPAGRAARAVAGGAGHTCAILDDGSVSCWGFGANGRLGYGNTTQRTTPGGPVALGAGRTAAAIGAGDAHTCAILDTGAVRCWGFGGQGRLGYGASTSVGDTPLHHPRHRRAGRPRRRPHRPRPHGRRGAHPGDARPAGRRERPHLHPDRRRHAPLLGVRRHRPAGRRRVRPPRLRRRAPGGGDGLPVARGEGRRAPRPHGRLPRRRLGRDRRERRPGRPRRGRRGSA